MDRHDNSAAQNSAHPAEVEDWIAKANAAPLRVQLFWGVMSGLVFGLLLSMAAVIGRMQPEQPMPASSAIDCPDDSEAFAWSLQFVREAVAPRRAKIDRRNYIADRFTADTCEWDVSGRFETVNAFGAPVAGYWTLRMKFADGTWYASQVDLY